MSKCSADETWFAAVWTLEPSWTTLIAPRAAQRRVFATRAEAAEETLALTGKAKVKRGV